VDERELGESHSSSSHGGDVLVAEVVAPTVVDGAGADVDDVAVDDGSRPGLGAVEDGSGADGVVGGAVPVAGELVGVAQTRCPTAPAMSDPDRSCLGRPSTVSVRSSGACSIHPV